MDCARAMDGDGYCASSTHGVPLGIYTGIVIMGSVVLAVYISTLSPSIAGGDSGEIVAEGCSLGISHPPGYPLLTMLIYVIKKYISVGELSVAFRVNAFSALLTAFASCCMGYTVALLTNRQGNSLPAIAGIVLSMGLFAFSPLIWQYAITAEVFPLNTAFAALIVALVVHHSIHRSLSTLRFGALICGLALCNQHTIILFEVPLILWMLLLNRSHLLANKSELIVLGVLFLLGLLPYCYMPIMASLKPEPGSWGHVTTLGGFLHHFLRKDYGTFQLFSGAKGKQTESMLERHQSYMNDLFHEQGLYISVLLLLVSLLCYRPSAVYEQTAPKQLEHKELKHSADNNQDRKNIATDSNTSNNKRRPKAPQPSIAVARSVSTPTDIELHKYTFYVLFVTLLFYFFIFHSLSNLPLDNPLLYGVHQRFWMQPNIIVFVLVGIGFQQLCEFFSHKKSSSSERDHNNGKHMNLLGYVFVSVAIGLVFAQYKRNIYMSDQSNGNYFKSYATAVLGVLPLNATLLINYDQQWTSVRYLQRCEGYRSDVTAINLSMMTYEWFREKHALYPNLVLPGSFVAGKGQNKKHKDTFTVSDFLKANPDADIYLGGKMTVYDPDFSANYEALPVGLVSKLTLASAVPSGKKYKRSVETHMSFVADQLLTGNNMPLENKYPEVTWEWTIGRDFRDRLIDTAAFALDTSVRSKLDPESLIYALYLLETALYLDCDAISAGRLPECPTTSLLKNAGLAHVHVIQNKQLNASLPLQLTGKDIFNSLDAIGWPHSGSWKDWCSKRFLTLWGEFLSRPDAKQDPQYANMKQMYEKASSAGASASSGAGTKSMNNPAKSSDTIR